MDHTGRVRIDSTSKVKNCPFMLTFSEHTSSMKTVKSIDQFFEKNLAKAALTFPIKFLLLVGKIINYEISPKNSVRETQIRTINSKNFGAGSMYGDYCLCHLSNSSFLKKLWAQYKKRVLLYGSVAILLVVAIVFSFYVFFKQ